MDNGDAHTAVCYRSVSFDWGRKNGERVALHLVLNRQKPRHDQDDA